MSLCLYVYPSVSVSVSLSVPPKKNCLNVIANFTKIGLDPGMKFPCTI